MQPCIAFPDEVAGMKTTNERQILCGAAVAAAGIDTHAVRVDRRRWAGAIAAGPWWVAGSVGALVPLRRVAAAEPLRVRRALMGTWIDAVLAEGDRAATRRAVDDAFAQMHRLATMMSRFDPASRLGVLNRAAGRSAVPVPPEMMSVLHDAAALARRTGGAVDVTVGALTPGPDDPVPHAVPDDRQVREALRHVDARLLQLDAVAGRAWLADPDTRVDLGALAKLPILAAGLDVLRARAPGGAMINGGGDVLVTERDDGRPWRIGVRDAALPDRLLAVLPMRAGVVVSSGDYERFVMHGGRRYHHIIDPATGRPAAGLHGVTLVAQHVDQVNGLGTAAMVVGPARALPLLQACQVREAILMGADGRVTCTGGLAQRLEPAPGRSAIRGLA